MRLTDQEKRYDIPYESAVINIIKVDNETVVVAADIGDSRWWMGKYNDEDEARDVMRKLAECYLDGYTYFHFPEKRPAYSDIEIESLELSCRTFNVLRRAGLHTVDQIVGMDEKQLIKLRNMGKKSIEELTAKMKEIGLWGDR